MKLYHKEYELDLHEDDLYLRIRFVVSKALGILAIRNAYLVQKRIEHDWQTERNTNLKTVIMNPDSGIFPVDDTKEPA
jgi:hypothetical protein